MLLAERDPNRSGRTSRASDMSTTSRGASRDSAVMKQDMPSANPAVVSMLRTSTEMGNIGGLFPDPIMSNVPRPSRRGASSRLLTASSRSTTSNRTSLHRHWHSTASTGNRRSRDNGIPQYVPDTLSPTVMNISVSSPLIPLARDSHRSLSMTMENISEPTFRLSSNRSLASLRSQDHLQHPRNTYAYPARLRRPGYRPTSPALSDTAGSYYRPRHGPFDQGLPPYGGQIRHRRPSDMAVPRPPSRSRTPVYYGDPHPEIPPVPPLMPHRHAAVEKARNLQRSQQLASHKSAKNSISSGSTNRRTDSDTPSSDTPTPPTPKDGQAIISPAPTRSVSCSISGTVKYYDYSEQYDQEEVIDPQADSVHTGLVHHIKTIIEELGTPEPAPKRSSIQSIEKALQDTTVNLRSVPELPASPIPRRITRDLVLANLGNDSSSGNVETSGSLSGEQCCERATREDQPHARGTTDLQSPYLRQSMPSSNRQSILSQAETSIIDSSTIEFAVRCSIPIVADKGMTIELGNDINSAKDLAVEPITEDGMTDLLEGYQHTEYKPSSHEIEINEGLIGLDGLDVERSSSHAAKPSDEQSFKSCTDLLDVAEPVKNKFCVSSSHPDEKPSEEDMQVKDSDAMSFRTCKGMVSPDRVTSLTASLPETLLSSQLASADSFPKRLFVEGTPSPLIAGLKLPPHSTSDPNVSRSGRFRANSKMSSAQCSTADSKSSRGEHSPQLPPFVPPRESSSSKEAQQSRRVANFLLRSVRQRFSKVSPGSNLKSEKGDIIAGSETQGTPKIDTNIPTPPPMRQRVSNEHTHTPRAQEKIANIVSLPNNSDENIKQRVQAEAPTIRDSSASVKNGRPEQTPDMRMRSPDYKDTPDTSSTRFPEPSSVYSPDGVSATRLRVRSSPGRLPQTPECHHRDSHTTTHLSWNGGRGFQPLLLNLENLRATQISGQDDTTTDLRLPNYKHPLNPLPDVKEDSHEDSSLNTSAGNFRPFAVSQSARFRMSIDEEAVLRRRLSVKSGRRSLLSQMHLPSMNFSSWGSFDEALDNRKSRSLELLPVTRDGLAWPDVQRPASAGAGRDKYKSVFAGLDTPAKTPDRRRSVNFETLWKRRTPERYVREVDSLTVPSINGLTTRLSEMLPQLKDALGIPQNDEFPDEEGIMKKALGEINEVGIPSSKRSSARLRPLPGSPHMIVVDDDVFKEITSKEKSERKTPEPDYAAFAESLGIFGNTRVGTGRHKRERARSIAVELGVPVPRDSSLSRPSQDIFPTPQSRLSSRSLGSFDSTPTAATATETRPWNSDKNYPWATNAPVDISFPPPSASKYSPRPGPSRLRSHLSNASSTTDTPINYATPASAFTKSGIKGPSFNILADGGSALDLSTAGFDASGYATRPVRTREEDQSHTAGERYPTSALPLPSNLHIYPGQASHFSVETSDEETESLSPRKALFTRRSRRNTKMSSGKREPFQAKDAQVTHSSNNNTDDEGDTLPDRSRRQTFANAEGMSQYSYIRYTVVMSVKNAALNTYDGLRQLFCCTHPATSAESFGTNITTRDPVSRPISSASHRSQPIGNLASDQHRDTFVAGHYRNRFERQSGLPRITAREKNRLKPAPEVPNLLQQAAYDPSAPNPTPVSHAGAAQQ